MDKSSDSRFWDWDTDPILSPGCTDSSHLEFRKTVRDFTNENITPFVAEWDINNTYDKSLHLKAVKAGIYGALWPKALGGTPPPGCGERPADIFHDFIFNDEISAAAAGGAQASCFVSLAIGLPPVLATGCADRALTEKVAREVITGQKRIALAVTEPYGGSDVAGIRTKAVLSDDKKFYYVTGEKTFITGGLSADYLTVAAITAPKRVSMFLVETSLPGVTIERIATQGWRSSETTRILLDNVPVRVAYLLGKEGDGFRPIMENFNHERWILAVQANRFSRNCLEDAVDFAKSRRTFGKRLIEHQVIRHKIAEMAKDILSTHAFIMTVAQSIHLRATQPEKVPASAVAGRAALCKVQATKVFERCAREASQVFGGKSFLLGSGVGGRVERMYRDVRVYAIGGGSEEILLDLAAKQAKL